MYEPGWAIEMRRVFGRRTFAHDAQATIAVDSEITHNAPEGELTLTRAKQSMLPGWKRPAKRES